MMDIDKAFDEFIEFPEGSSGNMVTTVSTKLFAKYCVEKLQEENERLLAANRHSEDMYRQIDDERKRLQAEVASLGNQLQWANSECTRARLDERQAMTYLSQVRIAAEHDGDFPSLVEHVKQMTEALRAAHEMAKAAWIEGSEAGWKAARGEE
jgi:predicted  nucleic acid-binding Zn-ribbon protein